MSYILDALKKAQAERQIGVLPSIHAPLSVRQLSVRSNKPRWLALAATALVALLLLARWSCSDSASTPLNTLLTALKKAPEKSLEKPFLVEPSSVAAVAAVMSAAPSLASNIVVSGLARTQTAPTIRKAAPLATSTAPTPPQPSPPSSPPQPLAAAKAADEMLVSLHELPEQLQREIAPLQIKGYIYSKDPAERLLLTDKALRHEGEEVAPGLILEQLQAKSAVFSYKGYRYRVPY